MTTRRKRVLSTICMIACSVIALWAADGPLFAAERLPPHGRKSAWPRTFREIPGITAEEIHAVEGVLSADAAKESFTYGIVRSVEGFYREDGSIGGSGANICAWLSELFGVPFTPRIFRRDELERGLLDGSIDFSGDFTPPGDTVDRYFATDTISERIIKYARRRSSQPLRAIGDRKPLRFGFLHRSIGRVLTHPYLEDAEISFISQTENEQEVIPEKLRSGELDVFIADSTIVDQFNIMPDIETGDFSPLLFKQVALITTNPQFKPILGVLNKYFRHGGLRHLSQLREEGLAEYRRVVFADSLNGAELAYYREHIGSKRPIRYSIRSSNYPIGFYNEEEGRWDGIAVDVLEEISRITGLAFEPASASDADWPEAYGMLERGEVPMITELLYASSRTGRYLWADKPNYTDHYALISKRDFKNIGVNEILYSRVGLLENTGQMEKFQEWFPLYADMRSYPTLAEALKALGEGEIDLLMTSEARFLSITNYMERSDFKINLVFNEALPSTFGFGLRETALWGLVNKAMTQVDTASIAASWKYRVFDYRTRLTRTRNFYLVLTVVLLLIVLTCGVWAYSTHREKEIFERAKLMYDAAPFGTFFWSKDVRILDCNQMHVKLFEMESKRECIERFFDLSPKYQLDGKPSADLVETYIGRAMREGGPITFEWMHQTADGDPRPCRITLIRVSYNGEHSVVGYTEDLREHLKMLRLIRQNECELQAARDAAEASARGKSEFLARMSHEMRTPMNAITGFSELMLAEIEERHCNSECFDWLGKIHNASMTLLSIINDILDISKIESGNFEVIPAEYDLPSLINDTITLNITRIGEKPLRFLLDIDESLPCKLYGDDLRIKQICNNLLSNALKYTRKGEVVWQIRCERDDDGESVWMTIRVRDTGVGIREDDLEKLFSDYRRLNTRDNRSIEGTGLGLVLTRKLTEAMDGSIGVESEYGRGSVFTAKIRQKYVTDVPIGHDVAETLRRFRYNDKKRLTRSNLNRVWLPYAKVLLVDDLPVNLEVARSIMKPYGMRIDCVTSGEEAVEAVREERVRYSAIFMDHMMPGMDGMEAARIIREEIGTEYARNLPIIVLTANAIVGNEEMFLANGFQAFLSKPIDIMRLDQVIRQWVRDPELERSKGGVQALEDEFPRGKTAGTFAESRFAQWRIEGLDLEGALSKCGEEEALLRVLQVFAEDTPALLEQTRRVTEDTLNDYIITVHGIKGSCRSISAIPLGDMAEELERAARDGRFADVEAGNGAFVEAADALLTGLRQTLEREIVRERRDAPDPGLLATLLESARNFEIDGVYDAMSELERYEYERDGALIQSLRRSVKMMGFKQIVEELSAREIATAQEG